MSENEPIDREETRENPAEDSAQAPDNEPASSADNKETEVKESHRVGASAFPAILEALFFAADEPLNMTRLKGILPGKPDVRKIRAAIEEINRKMNEEGHPLEVIEIAGGYQMRTRQYYHHWVRQLFRDKMARRLSQSALETLAIVAYKQPLSKAEVEAIRGVLVDGAMKTLLERRLIRIAGRSEKPGRPLLYATSKDFLRYFGLRHLDDLPKLEEFEELAKARDDESMTSDVPLGDERTDELEEAQKIGSVDDEELALEDERVEELEEAEHIDAVDDSELALEDEAHSSEETDPVAG